jgi:hypothetical protein
MDVRLNDRTGKNATSWLCERLCNSYTFRINIRNRHLPMKLMILISIFVTFLVRKSHGVSKLSKTRWPFVATCVDEIEQ